MKVKDFSHSFESADRKEAKARLEAVFDLLLDKVVELREKRFVSQSKPKSIKVNKDLHKESKDAYNSSIRAATR